MPETEARLAARPANDWTPTLTLHCLTWLSAGNLVGLLLSTLLLWPRLGGALEPFSYGRWMPLHMNLHLYGWCGLPFAGLFLHLFVTSRRLAPLARLAITAWSGSLLFGAVSWLAGEASGKLFLDWAGAARTVLIANLAVLALVLTAGYLHQLLQGRGRTPRPRRWGLVARGLLLAGLWTIPAVMAVAASPRVYPPINPDSGGATGGSLMGSVLGMVALVVAMPILLGLEPADGWRATRRSVAVLALHLAAFALLDHGDRSHHDWLQIAGMVSLLIWLPLLADHLRRFPWSPDSKPWLSAFGAWGTLLLATGVADFLPGILDRLKFTHALVAHAHVAMAGTVTCLCVLVLTTLHRRTPLDRVFADRRAFALWHGGSLALILALMVLGGLEGADAGMLYRSPATVDVLFTVRWAAGAAMTAASLAWLSRALAAAQAQDCPRPPVAPATARVCGVHRP